MSTPPEPTEPSPSPAAPEARTLIAVSLKLYFDIPSTLTWCHEVAAIAKAQASTINTPPEIVVLPSLPAIETAASGLSGSGVGLGAQDLFHEDRGPFTGAVSGADLKQIGCAYVEVGHFERRTIFGESDRTVGLKTRAAWRNGLTPILCVGETSQDSIDASVAQCVQQLASAIPMDLTEGAPIVVAYEPSWAIGAAAPAGPDHIAAVTREVAAWLAGNRPSVVARVIYGGSAGVGLLSALGDAVDGLFLGRFAHDTKALDRILDEAAHLG